MNQQHLLALHRVVLNGQRITGRIQEVLKSQGSTEPQYNILRILKMKYPKPMTIYKIQSKMLQKSSNVSRTVERLYKKGLIDRKINPRNRRKVDVSITDLGLQKLQDLDYIVGSVHQFVMKDLNNPEAESLSNLLSRLKC